MNKRRQQDNHHIVPRSRLKRGQKSDTVVVDKYRHALYHILFQNQLPEEVVEQLNSEFFGGKYEINIRRKE